MVEFITESPFTKRFQENQAASQRRDFRNIRIDTAQSEMDARARKRRQAEDIDRVTRETVRSQAAPQAHAPQTVTPPQGGVQPSAQPRQAPAQQASGFRSRLAQNLSGVRGGGAAAAELTMAELDRQQKIMEHTFDLAAQNPESALAWAEAQGMPVPPGMQNLIRNKQVSTAIANGMKRITQIFGNGAEQAGRRWQAMQQLLKGIDEQAKQMGGLPPEMQQGVIRDLPEPATAATEAPATKEAFDPETGRKVVMQWNGTAWIPLGGVESPEAARGRQGQPPAAVATAEWLAGVSARADGREVTDQDRVAAFEQLQQAKSNPVARANLVARVFDAMANDFTDPRPPAEKQAAAEAWINQLLAGPPRDMLAEAGLTPDAAGRVRVPSPPQSAAPMAPAAAPQPPAENLGAAPQTVPGPDGGQHPVVSSAEQYSALPPGAIYFHAGRQTFMRKAQ